LRFDASATIPSLTQDGSSCPHIGLEQVSAPSSNPAAPTTKKKEAHRRQRRRAFVFDFPALFAPSAEFNLPNS
jgi:hypothetical protein